ncbi:MAG: AbrB/MazE/SpoVT family DNA-binding domain-containing protein [Oscillospiraceae bacterium]|nr:AbrB/MazE/SpoVT family DNA-binding domain-containing protein [Oscillospiraceae bacterium]
MNTTVTIQKWGNSQGIRIPRYILDQTELDIGLEVLIEVQDGNIVLKKQKKRHKPLTERFEGYDEQKCDEFDWGEPQGEEVW